MEIKELSLFRSVKTHQGYSCKTHTKIPLRPAAKTLDMTLQHTFETLSIRQQILRNNQQLLKGLLL